MLAALSSLVFDPSGHILLNVMPSSAFQDRPRRVERVQTLDGGSVFNEFGFSATDKTILLRWIVTSRETEEAVDRMVSLYGRVNLSLDGSHYLVAIDTFTPGTTESQLSLLVITQTL